MKIIVVACGLYNVAFALFHFGFWRLFKWDSELKKLSFANRGIMQILNIQISYYFIFSALICFIFPAELVKTTLGNAFLIGNAVFWLIRTLQQFIFLNTNHYKIHLLTFIFLVGSILFALPVVLKS
ncbi:MAG: hypothetical protein ACXITV_01740 [Luteibaculaceae bacterium]